MIPTFDALKGAGEIEVIGPSLAQLFELVMDKGVALVRGAVDAEVLKDLRASVHEWGLQRDMLPPQTYIDDNFHSIESGISPRQKTPHCYHAYNFNRIGLVGGMFGHKLLSVFEKLSLFHNKLTDQDGGFDPDHEGRKQRPQIIHYPSGGGMFGRHIHPLEPQRVGLVLALSQRGVDFVSGGTCFEVEGRRFDTSNYHNIGDLILFRYDVPHWITGVDQGEKFDSASERGRWTAVLPYY